MPPVGQHDLIKTAADRRSSACGGTVALTRVHIVHHQRAVAAFRTVSGPVLVKIDTDPGRFRREVAALRAAADGGVPVPEILHACQGPPALLVLEYIGAPPLIASSPSAVWAEAGRALRRLHGLAFAPPPFGRPGSWRQFMLDWLAEETTAVTSSCQREPAIARKAHGIAHDRITRGADPPRQPIHGDSQPDHFLIAAGRLRAIIDFGDCGLGDPVWDLAVLTLHTIRARSSARSPATRQTTRCGHEPKASYPPTGSSATSPPLTGSTSTHTTPHPNWMPSARSRTKPHSHAGVSISSEIHRSCPSRNTSEIREVPPHPAGPRTGPLRAGPQGHR